MRARLLAAGLAACAVLVPAQPAAARQVDVEMKASGSVVVAWHSDSGCAAAGLCGYSGTTVMPTGSVDVFAFADANSPLNVEDATIDFENVLARVQRDGGSGRSTCVDSPELEFVQFDVVRARKGALGLKLIGNPESPASLAGRCAGPTMSDVAPALPRGTLSHRARLHGGVLDMSGRRPFRSGAFSGEVVSTLRLRIRRAKHSGFDESYGHPHAQPITSLSVAYRVTRLRGSVAADFGGAAEPVCRVLDACGARGSSTLSLSATGFLVVQAYAPSRRVHGRGPLAVLRAARHVHYGLLGGGGLNSVNSLSARVTPGGGGECRADTRLPSDLQLEAQPVHRGVALSVSTNYDPGSDPFRSRCPGPSKEDILGAGPLISKVLPVRALLRRRLAFTLTRERKFAGAYAGTAHERLRFTAVRKHLEVSTDARGSLP